MHFSTLIAAAFVAVASAKDVVYPPIINLGRFGYPHGNQFIAWSPFTPTTTQDVVKLCDTRGSVKGTATWTAVRTVNTYVLDPICRKPFNLTDDDTGTTYRNLELACVDDDIPISAEPEVTAVVDRNTNKTVHTCTRVWADSEAGTSQGCTRSANGGVMYLYACAA
ncbi:hypothetical protein CSHISOI_08791 [Colletotrichum shisoi]|uniref:Uncharacterized protein n=1 Tax=Colletotrichum shisoi TaxID=2078593 RepID=A0A5Q4BI86_9PEZI|nr:hypothetical protein CSHISOI_08791 [Colletotrichum shisoi]